MQLRVLRLGFFQDRYIGVVVFPEGEEILIGGLCLCLVTRQSVRSAQLQVRKCANGIGGNEATVIEDLLEFRGGFSPLVYGQISLATHVGGIEVPKKTEKSDGRHAQFMGN